MPQLNATDDPNREREQPVQQMPAPRDPLADLIDDLKRDAARIAEDEALPQEVRQYLGRNVLPTVRDLARELLTLRNWAGAAHAAHADHLNAHEDRFGYLEAAVLDSGEDQQLSEEIWTLAQRVAAAHEVFVTEAQKTTTDPEGQKKLDEQLRMAKRLQEELQNNISVLPDDDDDDDDDAS